MIKTLKHVKTKNGRWFRPKKPTRKYLIKKLDQLVSLKVREEIPWCVVCGSTANLQAGHLFSRKNYSTRWDLLNLWTQCAGCNLKHEHDPWPFYKWFIRKHGQDVFDKLYEKYHQITHFKDCDLQDLLIKLGERE